MGKRKAAKSGRAVRADGKGDPLDQTLAEIWKTISAGDVLHAELQASALVSLPFQWEGTEEQTRVLVDALIDAAMEQQYGPAGAAFLRLLMSLGPRVVKRAASEALAELTADDVYPPEWVTRIAAMVLGYAANTFTLTTAQRDGLEAAVSAWVRWAAARQNVDDAAARHLLSKLPEIFAEFPATYDDPVSVANRAYVRDVAASDTDAAWLDECRTRREFAVPLPASRDADAAAIDATTQGGRAALTEDEFASCAPEGAEGEKFIATAKGIVEELWHDDPPTTWQVGKSLLDQGLDEHDAIHRLAEIAEKSLRA